MKLRDLKEVLVDALDFRYDSTTEIIDYETEAHFREEEDGHIYLGGDYYCGNYTDLLNREVISIEPMHNSLWITIKS